MEDKINLPSNLYMVNIAFGTTNNNFYTSLPITLETTRCDIFT